MEFEVGGRYIFSWKNDVFDILEELTEHPETIELNSINHNYLYGLLPYAQKIYEALYNGERVYIVIIGDNMCVKGIDKWINFSVLMSVVPIFRDYSTQNAAILAMKNAAAATAEN
jgi:hypothetical protein